ncbi:MFS transporter [Sphingomonas sp. Leaf231]|uniref:MFS transporter n=1 Tax=Sphingomonas sp. Leaf231 TaxID=1736301 RepID=UPI00138F5910|nr:MFS transporter [Sphingomonas sp. Leaf231]
MGERLHDREPGRQFSGACAGGGAPPVQGPLGSLKWRRVWLAYGVAHVGKSLLWTASDLLTIYLLVTVYAVDPVIAGALFLGGLIANGIADLCIGLWLDRQPSHAAPLAACSLVLAAASFPATIQLAPHGPWALLAATLVFRISYAGCDVPHNALLTRLGRTPPRAAWLARVRTIGTALASLIAAWGVSGADAGATAPLLWMMALAALLVGSAMVPLLATSPLAFAGTRVARAPGRLTGLPLPFLTAGIIGIVGLGGLAKALLHLSASPLDGSTIIALLIAGRTLSALLPVSNSTPRRGLTCLSAAYVAAGAIAAACAWSSGAVMIVLIGFAMGTINLIGWTLLPALADGPRAYGVFTMTAKLALGASGLALAGGLGGVATFGPGTFSIFALTVAGACLVAAVLVRARLTPPVRRPFPVS